MKINQTILAMNDDPLNEPLLTIEDVCRILNICESSVWKLRGSIPRLKIGKSVRFLPQDVRAYILRRQ